MLISILRLGKMAEDGSGHSDDEVLAAFATFHGGYNADFAFQSYLGAACAIGRHRPHLLDRLLRPVIDTAVSMSVQTLDDFWRYAEFCVLRDLSTSPPVVQDFTEPTVSFLRLELREHEPLILRLLQERLASPDGWGSES